MAVTCFSPPLISVLRALFSKKGQCLPWLFLLIVGHRCTELVRRSQNGRCAGDGPEFRDSGSQGKNKQKGTFWAKKSEVFGSQNRPDVGLNVLGSQETVGGEQYKASFIRRVLQAGISQLVVQFKPAAVTVADSLGSSGASVQANPCGLLR